MRTYKDKYLNKLGRVDGVVSYTDDFLSALGVYNPNQTYQDTLLTSLGLVTLNSYYTPIKRIQRGLDYKRTLNKSASYLPCSIDVHYGGAYSYTLPIVFPQSITESVSANFIKESPVGSTIPIIAFSNTESQDFSMTFTAAKDYLPEGYSSLRDYVKAVKAMCKPRYNGNIVLAPSVRVTYSDVVFSGVCNSVSVEYEDVYGDKSMVVARFSCSFTLTGGV